MSRPNDGDDPVLHYRMSDRQRNDRTYYMVLGLYLLFGGSLGAMFVMRILGL